MAREPEIVFANVILASKITAPRSDGKPPFVVHSAGMNTWDAVDGPARVKFAACFNVMIQNARIGQHSIGMRIEDEDGNTVRTWEHMCPIEVTRSRYDQTGALQWETLLPVGHYRLCLLVDDVVRSVTALHVLGSAERS